MVESWMEAPMSPLSNEQIKQLAAAQVANTDWQPNESYMSKDDSFAMLGEVATQALEELDKLRAEKE